MFTIGVGFINLQELLAVASAPVCTHVYVLDNYAHIDSILYEIQKSTCEGKPDRCDVVCRVVTTLSIS